ncbi:nucleoside deaminase [Nocardioides jishulii]|uniref:nucleoside deaminase n=1 Tax=Nocardioides jishulii TaxID=2575440 RepID=UPI0023B328E1|nr:nucleoside deaminase [Nocardioides jishulii]
MSDDSSWLQRAIELATDSVSDGGGPFGAVIVRDGVEIAAGQNRVTSNFDPTAHAEVQAIRTACTALGEFSLAGCTVYASCEPCPMCLAACLWARVDRIVYAADRDDAARGGFDDRRFYELFTRPRAEWEVAVKSLRLPEAEMPFHAWRAREDRHLY